MSSAVPWWGSGLFTVCGAILGALATLSLGLLNRRSERRRLSRAEKVASYPELVRAAGQLAELAVWPADEDPRALYREVDGLARRIAFFGPAPVNATLGPVVVAAGQLAGVVAWVRAESGPGHQDQVDQRLAPRHVAAVGELTAAVSAFVASARADLEIRGEYTPIEMMNTDSDWRATISTLDREPGAGSREPGAGSREPARLGRFPRTCHAG